MFICEGGEGRLEIVRSRGARRNTGDSTAALTRRGGEEIDVERGRSVDFFFKQKTAYET